MATYERRKGFWRVKVRRAGFPPQTRSFNSKALAQSWVRDVEAKLDRGELVDRSEAHAHTLGDVLKRYLKEVSPHKKGHIPETYKVRAMLRFPVCQLRMSVLSSAHIAAYRDERAQSVKPATVNRDLGIISHAIETARREWGIHMPDNPVHRVRRLRAPLMRSRRLSPEEEQRLLAACEESHKPFLLPVVKLALETAMRRGEITRVERKRIDLKHSVLVLPDTKNGSARAVPLSNVAKAIIEQVLVEMPTKPDGLLFAGVTNEAIKLAFQRAVKRAKLDDFRFHDLRHEATSRLHEKGLNPIEVMSVTGHKSMSSMLRYSHVRGLAVTEKLNRPLDYSPSGHSSNGLRDRMPRFVFVPGSRIWMWRDGSINPATGLPMYGGVDSAGNPYGTDMRISWNPPPTHQSEPATPLVPFHDPLSFDSMANERRITMESIDRLWGSADSC